jgi:hypothetical protein
MWRLVGVATALTLCACTQSALRYESSLVETPRPPVEYAINPIGDRAGIAAHLRPRRRTPSSDARIYELCSRRVETADGTWLEAGDCRCDWTSSGANHAEGSSDAECDRAARPRVPLVTPNCDLGSSDPRQVVADAIEKDLSSRATSDPARRVRASDAVVAFVDGDEDSKTAKNLLLWALRDPSDPRAQSWLSQAITLYKRVLDADALGFESSSVESPRAFAAAYDLALAWRLFAEPAAGVDCSAPAASPRNLSAVYAAIAVLYTPVHYQGHDVLGHLAALDPGQLTSVTASFPRDLPPSGGVAAWTQPAGARLESRRLARELYLRRWHGDVVGLLEAAARLARDHRLTSGPVAEAIPLFYRIAAERSTRPAQCRRLLALARAPDGCGPGGTGRPVLP